MRLMYWREDASTATKIANVLKILNVGKWHTLEEIQQKTNLDKNQIQQVIGFLERYCFITVDETTGKVMLKKTVQEFLTQTSSGSRV